MLVSNNLAVNRLSKINYISNNRVLRAKKTDKKIIGHKEIPLSPAMIAWLKANPDELNKVANVLVEVNLERLTIKFMTGIGIAGIIERLGFHGAFLTLIKEISPELVTRAFLKAHDPVVYALTAAIFLGVTARYYYITHKEGSKEIQALDELALKMRKDPAVQETLIDFLTEQGALKDKNWSNKLLQKLHLQKKTQHTLEQVFEDRKLFGWFKQEMGILEPYLKQLQKELKQETKLTQPKSPKKKSWFSWRK